MDTKSRILLTLLFLAVVTSAFLVYYRIMVQQDFEVTETGESVL